MAKATISNRVKELRFFADEMTQQQLAHKIGCTRQTINALEQGKYVPSLSLAFQIARVFDTTIEEIFSFVESIEE